MYIYPCIHGSIGHSCSFTGEKLISAISVIGEDSNINSCSDKSYEYLNLLLITLIVLFFHHFSL